MNNRRFQLSQLLGKRGGGRDDTPGLEYDDSGNVIIVGPDGVRHNLTALAARVQAPEADGGYITGWFPGAPIDGSAEMVVGVVPYDSYITGVAYSPVAEIVFRDRSGSPNVLTDRIDSRAWKLERTRALGQIPAERLAMDEDGAFESDPVILPYTVTTDADADAQAFWTGNGPYTGTPAQRAHAGYLKLAATQTATTLIYASIHDARAKDVTRRIEAIGIENITHVRLYKKADPNVWLEFAFVSVGAGLATAYGIHVSDGEGSSASPFAEGDAINIKFVVAADDLPPWLRQTATLAEGVYDAQAGGPVDADSFADLHQGRGIGLDGHGRSMLPGVSYPLVADEMVAQSVKKGDIVRFLTYPAVDLAGAGEGWHGTVYAPADPGGLIQITFVPVVDTAGAASVAAASVGWATARAPLPDDRIVGSGEEDADGDVLNQMRSDRGDLPPSQIDPGGGGGIPKWYCFEWFGHKWGLDFLGWIDFTNELRARGQSEAAWACAHPQHAQCIEAAVLYESAGSGLQYTNPRVAYQCSGGSAEISMGLETAIPIVLTRSPGLAVGIGAGLIVLQSTGLLDRVEVDLEILHLHTPIAKKRYVFDKPDRSTILEVPGIDTASVAIPGDLPAGYYGPSRWTQPMPGFPTTTIGAVMKATAFGAAGTAILAKTGIASRVLDAVHDMPLDPEACIVRVAIPVTETVMNGGAFPQIKRPSVICSVEASPPRVFVLNLSIIDRAVMWVGLVNPNGKTVAGYKATWIGPRPDLLNHIAMSIGKERNYFRFGGIRRIGWTVAWEVVITHTNPSGITRNCVAAGVKPNPNMYDVRSDDIPFFGTFALPWPEGAILHPQLTP